MKSLVKGCSAAGLNVSGCASDGVRGAPSSNGIRRRELLTLAAMSPLLFQGSAEADGVNDPVKEIVADFVRRGNVEGLSVAVIRDGRTHFYNAGVSARGGRNPVTELSIYEIGSISKTFTGLLLARAIREGKAAAADDVRQYLPPGYDNLQRDGRPVRLIDLVNTTSALPDNLPDWRKAAEEAHAEPAQIPFIAARLMDGSTKSSFMEDLKSAILVDTPGAAPRHSNVASQLMGIVLERIYGRSYEALLAEFIERPLRMSSGFAASSPSLVVQGYDPNGPATPPHIAPVMQAAAGLRYSTSDMARYIATQLAAHDPDIALTQKPAWGDPDTGAIGFHWIINRTADSKLSLRHSGGTFGFSAHCEFYPGQGYGIVLLSNRAGAQDALGDVANATREALFGRPRGLVALEEALERSSFQDVSASVAETRVRFPELFLSENYVNAWGYRLKRSSRPAAAQAMFAYNVEAHPDSWNVHDSYAEALAANGDNIKAIAHYRRSLTLNPDNGNASDMIAKLGASSNQ
jgi:CubicO group peptidase (beta-lactamase class C family)